MFGWFEGKNVVCKRSWQERSASGLGQNWSYVNEETGRLDDAEISFDGKKYTVWSRGSGFGDYATFEQAKIRAEKVMEDRGIK
jgi:hypothetical protein